MIYTEQKECCDEQGFLFRLYLKLAKQCISLIVKLEYQLVKKSFMYNFTLM